MAERFTEILMEHFLDPRNRGTLDYPNGTGVSGVPGQGPFIVIQLACTHDVISQARFNSHNCGVTVATGSVLTELIQNRRLDYAMQLSSSDIETALGGIPVDKRHVPEGAIAALRQAIAEARS
jgi:nitrogen fixation NifU-like protein